MENGLRSVSDDRIFGGQPRLGSLVNLLVYLLVSVTWPEWQRDPSSLAGGARALTLHNVHYRQWGLGVCALLSAVTPRQSGATGSVPGGSDVVVEVKDVVRVVRVLDRGQP